MWQLQEFHIKLASTIFGIAYKKKNRQMKHETDITCSLICVNSWQQATFVTVKSSLPFLICCCTYISSTYYIYPPMHVHYFNCVTDRYVIVSLVRHILLMRRDSTKLVTLQNSSMTFNKLIGRPTQTPLLNCCTCIQTQWPWVNNYPHS